ncbi:uncharacterized protein LOC142539792 isoform X1 [Primulina tabacum]|uniref:uncharacterized protein LOC142539792 isoform X1 n=1 Tax=Primulina tabacum TaxID=48773 RepID=UPI003F5A801D
MGQSTIRRGRFTYVHDVNGGPPEAIDVHHIFVSNTWCRMSHLCTYALLFAIPGFLLLHHPQDTLVAVTFWGFISAGFLLWVSLRRQIKKAESVIIFAAFGVQLETMFKSGRTVRHFVPISKILKPVLVECVTPFSCYWSLSLIIRGEEELLPVFKGLYPPVKMLVPIWKALCVAIANGECNLTLDDSLPSGEMGT